jgi:hypothetical protein
MRNDREALDLSLWQRVGDEEQQLRRHRDAHDGDSSVDLHRAAATTLTLRVQHRNATRRLQ